ncbi:MAG: hypothetical protein O3B01_23795 [Planctomycetota bacterium]|nr:hypothetical protein [Planctomycetota bacterium]MDA1141596.1 hypothetical protein [Planctomycetota bacterium]
MTEILSLTHLNLADITHLAGGYSPDSKYVVANTDDEECASFDLQLAPLKTPYIKKWVYDDDSIQRYQRLLDEGFRLEHTTKTCLWVLQ